jgi:hypothetical protein
LIEVYSAVIGGAPLAAMAVAAVSHAARDPAIVRVLGWTIPPGRQFALAVGLVLVAFALGSARGPVIAEPFRLGLALDGPAPWSASLARPLIRNWLGFAGVLVAGIGMLGALALAAGVADSSAVVYWALAWVAAVPAALVAWLAGQRWPAAGRAAGLLALVAAGLIALAPAGVGGGLALGAFLGGAAGGPMTLILVMAVTALLGWLVVPVWLTRLDSSLVLLQAERWSAASLAIRSGYFSDAGLAYTACPARSPRRSAGRGRRWWSRAIWLDLLGVARTPVRLAGSLMTLALAGVLLHRVLAAVALGASGPGWIALAAATGVLASAGVRGLSDGLRHVAEDASSPSNYGVGVGRLLGAHAVLPSALSFTSLAAGDGLNRLAVLAAPDGPLAVSAAAGAGTAPLAVLAAIWLATGVAMAALNTLERVKGEQPEALYVPAYTPMGDPTPVLRAVWQVWPQLAAAGWGLLAAWAGTGVAGLAFILASAVALAAACLRQVARQ